MSDQVTGLLSPWLRRRRLAAVRRHLSGRVLDFGCGTGAMTDLVDPGRYVGFDADAASVDEARRQHPGFSFTSQLDEVPGQFDTIVLLAVIEHLHEPEKVVGELVARLQPGGRLVATTPHPRFEWLHELGAKLGIVSQEAAHEHDTLYDRGMLATLFSDSGLQLESYRRLLGGLNQLAVARRPSSTEAAAASG